LFHVRHVAPGVIAAASPEAPSPGVPVELQFGCEGHLELYLNGSLLAKRDGWIETGVVEAYAKPGANTVAVKVTSKAAQPGVVGMIRVGGVVHVTRPDAWSLVPCPKDVPAPWLLDPKQGGERAAIGDMGGFGDEPWHRMSGAFAGTKARWLWADRLQTPQDSEWWLLRRNFDVAAPKP
jgi:hypothetical protein